MDADIELGHKLSVSGVPTLFMNGQSVRVPYGIAELEDLLGQP